MRRCGPARAYLVVVVGLLVAGSRGFLQVGGSVGRLLEFAVESTKIAKNGSIDGERSCGKEVGVVDFPPTNCFSTNCGSTDTAVAMSTSSDG